MQLWLLAVPLESHIITTEAPQKCKSFKVSMLRHLNESTLKEVCFQIRCIAKMINLAHICWSIPQIIKNFRML